MCATAIEAPCSFANRHADNALALLPKSRQLSDKSATSSTKTVQPTSVNHNSTGITFAPAQYSMSRLIPGGFRNAY